MEAKKVSESLVIMTEMIFPNDTNTLNNLMGGRLLYLMDVVSAIAAQRHTDSVVVTASVDNVSFANSIPLGAVVTLEAQVSRAFNSSMEVHIKVTSEDIPAKTKIETNEAFFTFVAVDSEGKPKKIPKAIPETEDQKKLYESALRRRQLRLVLAGRMQPEEAKELRSIFNIDPK